MKTLKRCKYCRSTNEDHNVLAHYGANDTIELEIKADMTQNEYEKFIKLLETASRPIAMINGIEFEL